MKVERVSAITLKVQDMRRSVRFYRGVLGLQIVFGGEDAPFSTFSIDDAQYVMLNLEQGKAQAAWGRVVLYVDDVDASWRHLKKNGFDPEIPRDATWGERYFHVSDPDGHELSFAKRLA